WSANRPGWGRRRSFATAAAASVTVAHRASTSVRARIRLHHKSFPLSPWVRVRAGTRLATSARVRLVFDRGTLLLEDPPADLDLAAFPECRWDSRVGKHRAPAFLAYRIASDLRRRGIALDAAPRPALGPATGFRPVELRPYQDAA